ncbi:MAG: SpoIIE family protein phosphatase [Chloroherpetonaceae bacterium]|nr:SpoIIE family protein phosphatase [Chloroherpetonaceae bacterium]MDW8437045.1 SpoIIE family protein phosphatase [Chloroherpetonaceae bacterium]
MKEGVRFRYALFLALLVSEILHLSLDIGLFYAGDAKPYLISLGILFVKDALACVAAGAMYLLIRRQLQASAQPDAPFWVAPEDAFKRGASLIALNVALIAIYGRLFEPSDFNPEDEILAVAPQSVYTAFKTHLSFLTFGAYLLAMFVVIERLILFRRARNTKVNFILMATSLALGAVATFGARKGDALNLVAIAFLSVAGLMMIVNLFRLSWILPIRRDEKIRALFLAPVIIGGVAIAMNALRIDEHFAAHSFAVSIFLKGVAIFCSLYLVVTLFSLLFYLPASEAYERKSIEVRNLYAMSKFITDVLEEEKIYDSLVGYARDAFGASSLAWFDLHCPYDETTRAGESAAMAKLPNLRWKNQNGCFKTVAQQNVSLDEIHRFSSKAEFVWREIAERASVVRIDDVKNDERLGASPSAVKNFLRRFKRDSNSSERIVSFIAVPLVARNKLMGALCVAKDYEHGFVKEDIELIATFADQAALAIDNARLIRALIDKERLQQELLVAQKIQLRLLPQTQPKASGFEVDGVSYPAYEVGGDYYDYVPIGDDERRIGVIVADVSGKGTSAAFYMAELKGVVQSLARIYPDSPKEFLCRANETISRGLEKGSFISAIYGIVDTERKSLHLSNAGHCPAIVVQGDEARFIEIKGLALGLDKGAIFSKNIRETRIDLNEGDVVVFYTDGVVEAIDKNNELFGYWRLAEVARHSRRKSASEIKNDIFNAVNAFTNDGGAVRDDLTIVVLKRLAA